MLFKVRKNPIELLKKCGYKILGRNPYSWYKPRKFGRFHAIVEYNNEIVHIHIDEENAQGTFNQHSVIQHGDELYKEAIKIQNQQMTDEERKLENNYNISAWRKAWRKAK